MRNCNPGALIDWWTLLSYKEEQETLHYSANARFYVILLLSVVMMGLGLGMLLRCSCKGTGRKGVGNLGELEQLPELSGTKDSARYKDGSPSINILKASISKGHIEHYHPEERGIDNLVN